MSPSYPGTDVSPGALVTSPRAPVRSLQVINRLATIRRALGLYHHKRTEPLELPAVHERDHLYDLLLVLVLMAAAVVVVPEALTRSTRPGS